MLKSDRVNGLEGGGEGGAAAVHSDKKKKKKDGQILSGFWKGSPFPQWELLLPCSPEISCFVLPYSPQSFKLRRVPSFPKNLDSGVSCSSKLLVLFIFNSYIISSPEINTTVFLFLKISGKASKGGRSDLSRLRISPAFEGFSAPGLEHCSIRIRIRIVYW